MNLPDKCPTCLRADRSSPASIRRSLERDVETWQAEAARLAARVAELEARCRRLEEAAREVYLDSIASDHQWTKLETRNMHALRDVLETNP